MNSLFIIFYVISGVAIGTLTGLIPGLHPNTVSVILLGIGFGEPINTSVLIVSAAVAHSFLDFIPSILLGAPDSSTALSVLPGHKMLMRGRAYEAIRLTVIGGMISMFFASSFVPLLAFSMKTFYHTIAGKIHWILITITVFMFFKDRNPWGFVVFGLSGLLGYVVLNGNLLGDFSVLPMLTGLFGVSVLLKSLRDKVIIPEQSISREKITKKEMFKSGFISSISGSMVSLLPGVGAAQATFISSELVGKKDERSFMLAVGGVNTVVAILSILSLWLIGKPRSGVAVAIKDMLFDISTNDVIIFMGAVFIAGAISSVMTIKLSKKFLNIFRKINYRKVTILTVFFLLFLTFWLTGIVGVGVMLVSTSIGMLCALTETRRSYMMACLIVPTILFFI